MTAHQTPADFGFDPNDLKPLGNTFVNDPPFRVEDGPKAFRVLPPLYAARRNLATWAIVGLFFVGFYLLIDRVVAEADKRRLGLTFVVLLGVATCTGGYAWVTHRQRRFERRGPVIDFDKATGRLSIPGGRTFQRTDVVGLLCCAFWHTGVESERLAELSIVVMDGGKRMRYLLLTLLDGSPHAFDYIAKPFIAATGLPAYRIWNEGLFGAGRLRAKPITQHLSV